MSDKIPPADPRYADQPRRVSARFGDLVTGAHIAPIAAQDSARYHPATHCVTAIRPRLAIEKGMIFTAGECCWEIVHAIDPVMARLVAEMGEQAAARAKHQDVGKFVALYCREAPCP